MRPFAYCDGEGNFKLKTYVDDDGAPAGKYRVSVLVSPRSRSNTTKDQGPDEAAIAPGSVVDVPPASAGKFRDADTAGIEITVQEGENNLPPFELNSGGGGSISSKN